MPGVHKSRKSAAVADLRYMSAPKMLMSRKGWRPGRFRAFCTATAREPEHRAAGRRAQKRGVGTLIPTNVWIDSSHLIRRMQMTLTEPLPASLVHSDSTTGA